MTRHVDEKDDVFLESALGWVVDFLILPRRKANNAIADFEAGDAMPDFYDFTRDVRTKNKWAFDPGVHHAAGVPFNPIDRVDGYCAILDHDLVLLGRCIRCGLDFQRGSAIGGHQPCCCVNRHSGSDEEAGRTEIFYNRDVECGLQRDERVKQQDVTDQTLYMADGRTYILHNPGDIPHIMSYHGIVIFQLVSVV